MILKEISKQNKKPIKQSYLIDNQSDSSLFLDNLRKCCQIVAS